MPEMKVFLQPQRLAKGQPKRSVGCPAEAASFAAGVYLSNLLGLHTIWNSEVNI